MYAVVKVFTHADKKVSSHEPTEDVFGIVVIRVFIQERRRLDCRHSVSMVTGINLRPGTVNGHQLYQLLG